MNKNKETGVIRKLDELGRIVIPIEIRKQFDIQEKDAIEIFVDKDNVVLKKYKESCIFCGNEKNVKDYKGKMLCDKCIKNIKIL